MKGIILCIIIIFLANACARTLFFGKTHSGKTTLINACCGLSLRVALPDQIESTTATLDTFPCLNTEVTDSIGIFDYHSDTKQRLSVHETLVMLLTNAQEGLSSVVWVWPSRETVGSNELEEIFETLRILLPEIPMAIADNKFPGSASGVPRHLGSKYKLNHLLVSKDDVGSLKDWLQTHINDLRIKLPPDWKDFLVKHDMRGLRKELFKASMLSCDTVKSQLEAITNQLNAIKQPTEQCNCAQDCRRSKKYCCQRILGVCISKCKEESIDTACQDAVHRCYETCTTAHSKIVAHTNELMNNLNDQYHAISSGNTDLLQTCDKFKLGSTFYKEEL